MTSVPRLTSDWLENGRHPEFKIVGVDEPIGIESASIYKFWKIL